MIRRHLGEEPAGDRGEATGEGSPEAAVEGDARQTEKEDHDADEPDDERHRRLRALGHGPGDLGHLTADQRGPDHRDQDDSEPDPAEHDSPQSHRNRVRIAGVQPRG